MSTDDGISDYDPPVRQFPDHYEDRETEQGVGWRLRPFLLTSGRARVPDESIGLETQVVATQSGLRERQALRFERRDIVELCAVPLSVAEISARLSLHLGVVRVLVADLAAEDLLHVHVVEPGASHNVHTILRVINGLRAIS
ncbi:DUF742 domain-containing protein [Streptomyces sp. NPDC056707]|uniref:DUF742 domain-containing protein n=1 Tax=Streptomyces sp. NPDC056707 TaxID=3345919 RepID=UPI003675276A